MTFHHHHPKEGYESLDSYLTTLPSTVIPSVVTPTTGDSEDGMVVSGVFVADQHQPDVIPDNSYQTSAASGPRSPSPPGGYGMASGYGGMCSPARGGIGGNTPVTAIAAGEKLDAIRQWSISTYKCTRQAIQERLGKTTRTMDVEVESAIDSLREAQSRYQNILRMTRALASHFANVLECQRALAAEFSTLASKEEELRDDLKKNSETQKSLVSSGESLLGALNFFVNTLNTLCNKTIDDTLLTIKNFETARLEYDAYRSDLEALQQSTSRGGDFQSKLHDAQNNVSSQKQRYEQLREDVQVKLKFLHENKVKVLQKQLLLFHNATSAYFTGNKSALDATMKQFAVNPTRTSASFPSFLEQ